MLKIQMGGELAEVRTVQRAPNHIWENYFWRIFRTLSGVTRQIKMTGVYK